MFDVRRIREDFPILREVVNGHPLVYLDNAATTQKPRQVIDALVRYYETSNANIHRGIHTLAVRATVASTKVVTREGAAHRRCKRGDIVFTRNTTEAINLIARAWGDANIREGDEIVLTITGAPLEHRPVADARNARKGAVLRYADITEDGELDWQASALVVSPEDAAGERYHLQRARNHQTHRRDCGDRPRGRCSHARRWRTGRTHLSGRDVSALGCDFYAFSAHKMLGPTGVGVLWARPGLLEAMDPFLGGGEMISVVKPDISTWADVPHKFEAGAQHRRRHRLRRSARLSQGSRHGAVRDHTIHNRLCNQCRSNESQGYLSGPHATSSGAARTVRKSTSLDDIHPHDVSTVVDSYGVAIRSGHHCARASTIRRLKVCRPPTGTSFCILP